MPNGRQYYKVVTPRVQLIIMRTFGYTSDIFASRGGVLARVLAHPLAKIYEVCRGQGVSLSRSRTFQVTNSQLPVLGHY